MPDYLQSVQYNTIPSDSDVLRFAYDGKYAEITKLFETGLASALGVDIGGWSLLDVSISPSKSGKPLTAA
jgi:hypothetical protein